ncbi:MULTISPECIES: xanthine dehydrogenase accessory protein XdhC [Thiomicrorhabdus]|uniref:Xanthine dehydrogenase accessory protein XdhC n=1 Tax=Thiomicrorhabdus heinhorstiae TaxID=2748010 RepID=A0ABS0BYL3_9GAMM|nr:MULTISPECIES: xanthine dehydrogenase accessory protein XdhC [Thiomicrorhabdus]MBF6058494.1 xanthine dehydrogenase accessory protein XdhC [Thiomicrorhabdus heinhorstiae]
MLNWSKIAAQADGEEAFVLISVGKVKGSSPRETGAKMLVWQDRILGTIGGGNMELQAIKRARASLQNPFNTGKIDRTQTPLIPKFDQCCGGVVELIFEHIQPQNCQWLQALRHYLQKPSGYRYLQTDLRLAQRRLLNKEQFEQILVDDVFCERIEPHHFPLYLFGCGHVGRALMQQLQAFDAQIVCIDSRPEQFPDQEQDNVEFICDSNWQPHLEAAPDNAYFLVFTHSHQLDYQIAEAILKRDRHNFFGLIGSRTKRVRFERQFRQTGVDETCLEKMHCPIGLPELKGKAPQIIAASVVAQLLIEREKNAKQQTSPLAKETIYV